LASSETMIDAFQRAARYSSLVNEGLSLKCIDDRDFGMAIRYVGVSRHLDRHQIEFYVTVFLRTCRQLTCLRIVPSRVRLIHFRERPDPDFSEFFGDSLEFGAESDEVIFEKNIRDQPVISADPYLNTLLTTYCEEALSRRPRDRWSFRSNVEN